MEIIRTYPETCITIIFNDNDGTRRMVRRFWDSNRCEPEYEECYAGSWEPVGRHEKIEEMWQEYDS